MNLSKAIRKAGPFGLVAAATMRDCEGVTQDGHPAVFAEGRWKVFRDMKAKLTWNEASSEYWRVLPYKLAQGDDLDASI